MATIPTPTREPQILPGDPVRAFDAADPRFRRWPYPRYAELREHPELHVMPDGTPVLTRYDDVLTAVRDRRLSTNPEHATTGMRRDRGGVFDALGDTGLSVMLVADPPDHTRLRRLANRAFTVRAVERLRPRIVELVGDLLDRMEDQAEPDLMRDIAEPLPVLVICEMLGIPVEDQHQFKPWSDAVARMIDMDADEAMLQQSLPAVMGFVQYFGQLIEQRRQDPGDDLLSALVAAEEDGDSLSMPELHAMLILLFVAGHETTTNLIGNGALALLRNRSEFDKLRATPELAQDATEELLRYDSPVQVTARTAMEDVEINGVGIPKGHSVICGLAAANRDPHFVVDPDTLRIDRDPAMHVSFSNGMHHCLGAPLARLEGQETFKELARRYPDLDLAVDDPPYRDHFVLRGLSSFPVSLG